MDRVAMFGLAGVRLERNLHIRNRACARGLVVPFPFAAGDKFCRRYTENERGQGTGTHGLTLKKRCGNGVVYGSQRRDETRRGKAMSGFVGHDEEEL